MPPTDSVSRGTNQTTEQINAQNANADPNNPYVQQGTTGGYLTGTGVTIGQGSSMTPAQRDQYIADATAAGMSQDQINAFIAQNAGDYGRLSSAYARGGAGAPADGQDYGTQDYGMGYPYPERVAMPDPMMPTPYSSTYQPQLLNQFQGVGEADRNRLMAAILGQPETMGALQQSQLFEQQKELLNAQRAQQSAQLQQNMAQRGLTGGAYTAGQAGINQQFTSDLLGAQRDIAIKAAQQNRADQLAALNMQEAMAQGDYQRMASIYQANQQERANTENFLRQAAELTQQGQTQYSGQRLAQAVAQQSEISDFYRFLENQRQFQNQLLQGYYTGGIA